MTTSPTHSQGAPEGILDRCNFVRVNGTDRQPLTPEIKQQILEVVKRYGTGNHGNCWYGNCGVIECPAVSYRSGHSALPSDGDGR